MLVRIVNAPKKFSNRDFFSKCDQTDRNLRIWLHLLKKPLTEVVRSFGKNGLSRGLF